MKNLSLIVLSLLIYWSCSTPTEESKSKVTGDTIQTESGLRYVYLKEGKGKKVQPGAMLDTKLSLMVEDSVVWTSYELEDSIFSFIADAGMVIQGFNEMAMLMREGDNVMAILPHTLAYGEKGSGNVIPPKATLVYDRYELLSVSEPKGVSIDTLMKVLKSDGVEEMKNKFFDITTTADSSLYHPWGPYGDFLFLRKIYRDSFFEEHVEAVSFIGNLHQDPSTLASMANSLKVLGREELAIDSLKGIVDRYPDHEAIPELEKQIEELEDSLNP